MSAPLNEPLTGTFTRGQWLTIGRAIRRDQRKKAKEQARSTFVPEEGHLDVGHLSLVRLNEIADTINTIIGPGFDMEDGGRPRRRDE